MKILLTPVSVCKKHLSVYISYLQITLFPCLDLPHSLSPSICLSFSLPLILLLYSLFSLFFWHVPSVFLFSLSLNCPFLTLFFCNLLSLSFFCPVTLCVTLSHPFIIWCIPATSSFPLHLAHFLSSFLCLLSVSNCSLIPVALSPFPPHAFTPSYFLLSPFLLFYQALPLSLSLFILRGVPDPIHSFLFKTVDPLLAITLHAPLSLNIPSPCPPTTLTFLPPPPLLFYPLSLSLALLPLLSRSNLSPEGSDWQASGGLVKGEFLIGGEGDEKDKASWTCPVCTAKKHSL